MVHKAIDSRELKKFELFEILRTPPSTMVRSIPIDLTDIRTTKVRLCVTDQACHMGGE